MIEGVSNPLGSSEQKTGYKNFKIFLSHFRFILHFASLYSRTDHKTKETNSISWPGEIRTWAFLIWKNLLNRLYIHVCIVAGVEHTLEVGMIINTFRFPTPAYSSFLPAKFCLSSKFYSFSQTGTKNLFSEGLWSRFERTKKALQEVF